MQNRDEPVKLAPRLNTSIAIGPRIMPETAKALACVFGSRNAGAVYVLDAWRYWYNSALAEIKRAGLFSSMELKTMLTASAAANPDLSERVLITEYPEVLRSLSDFQRHALALWCSEYWHAHNTDDAFLSSHIKRLAT